MREPVSYSDIHFEHAKTGRAKCQECRWEIREGEVKVVKEFDSKNDKILKSYHTMCAVHVDRCDDNRSNCHTCKEKINKGDMKAIAGSSKGGAGSSTKHHYSCLFEKGANAGCEGMLRSMLVALERRVPAYVPEPPKVKEVKVKEVKEKKPRAPREKKPKDVLAAKKGGVLKRQSDLGSDLGPDVNADGENVDPNPNVEKMASGDKKDEKEEEDEKEVPEEEDENKEEAETEGKEEVKKEEAVKEEGVKEESNCVPANEMEEEEGAVSRKKIKIN